MSAARGLRGAGLLFLSVGLAATLTYPVAFRLDRVGRTNTGDGRWSIWCVAWVAHALTSQPSRLFDANIFYPHRHTLAYSENNIVAGVLGIPAWLATRNAFATHNTAMLAGFALAFLSACALARHLTGDTGLGVAAGIAYAYCPFVFARTAHIQLMMTFGIPLSLLALHRLVARPTAVRGLQLAGALVLQALACGYYGIFAGLVVGLGVLLFAASRSLWRLPRYWIAVGVAAAAALAAVAPFYVLYANVQREFGFSRTIEDAAMYSANWPAWLASSSVAHRWLHPLLGSRWSEVLFPGFLTTGLGVAGAWLSWRKAGRSGPGAASALEFRSRDTIFFYVVIAVLAFWLSFGPSAGLYAVFFEIVPAFSLLRAPARFALLVTLALSALMAMGLAGWMASQTPGRRRIAGRLLAAALTLELASVPLAMPEVEPFNDAYRFLATARPGPVAEFPFFYYRPDYPRHTTYMLNSTAHWQPLVNGYSDHIPADFRAIVEPLSSFPTRESFEILKSRRTRYVIFHLYMYDSRLRQRLMERLDAYQQYLTPLSRSDEIWLYEIVGWP